VKCGNSGFFPGYTVAPVIGTGNGRKPLDGKTGSLETLAGDRIIVRGIYPEAGLHRCQFPALFPGTP